MIFAHDRGDNVDVHGMDRAMGPQFATCSTCRGRYRGGCPRSDAANDMNSKPFGRTATAVK